MTRAAYLRMSALRTLRVSRVGEGDLGEIRIELMVNQQRSGDRIPLSVAHGRELARALLALTSPETATEPPAALGAVPVRAAGGAR